MPDQKISQLTSGGAAQATDEIPIARSGTNVKVTGADIAAAATSVGTLSSLTVSGAASIRTLAASGQSLTGAQATSLVDLAATWNTTGTPTAIKLNVTDTASNASSLLMDLQVSSSSRATVRKDGYVSLLAPAGGSGTAMYLDPYNRQINVVGGQGFQLAQSGNVFLHGDFLNGQWSVWARQLVIGYSNADINLLRDAAGTLAQRNSTNAQTFRLYNTFTDASNYERGKLEWASNVLRIGTEKAGTGTARALELQTDGTTRVTVHPTDGTVTIGGYVFNDPSYGIRRTAANALTLTGGTTGNASIDCAATFVGVNAIAERSWANAQIRFDDITSTTIAAVALRNGTQPQRLHVYSTFSSTTSYERLTVAAQTAAAFQIRTNKGSGGGTARALELGTDDTTRVTIPTTGGCVVGTAALATNATDGFLYVPTCAGTPTGTPTAQTGTVPIVVDTTNNKLYFYSGAAWRDAGP